MIGIEEYDLARILSRTSGLGAWLGGGVLV